MHRKSLVVSLAFAFAASTAMAADTAATQGRLPVAVIVNKNVAARGGLQAWRAVHTISLEGTLGVGGNQRPALPVALPGKKAGKLPSDQRPAEEVQLPFLMEMQRPRKVRFELQFKGQTAVQVFDGTYGWKLRPYLNRREVEPYTSEELKKASMQVELDGPLVDYVAKGTMIELDGMEKVEDRDNYKLKLTMKNGQVIHVWVDAQTFLESKIEGQSRRLDGVEHPVEIYYRNYRSVNGLQIPFVLETKVVVPATNANQIKQAPIPTEKIIVENVVVNPKLDASHFTALDIQAAENHH
jgi:hypothetical protein